MNITDIIFSLKGFPLGKAMKETERLFGLSADERSAHQEQKKWEIARYHYQHNKVYRNLVGPSFPERWSDLPIITKKDLQGDLKSLIATPYTPANTYIGNTSGSSGHPFFFAKDKFTHALTWQMIRWFYKEHGITPGDLQARFFGIPLERSGYMTEMFKDRILNRVRFPVFDLSDDVMHRFTQVFRRKKFTYVYGYTNSIILFARYLLRQNIVLKDICPTLKVCIVTSEVCTPEDRKIIEEALGLGVVREYGASELCILAFDRPGMGWQVNDKTLFLETESGLPEGNLLCTSLYNKAFPIIRYRIGDVARLSHNESGMIIDELQGRTNDTIKLPSGRISPGFTFYYISRSILESSGILQEFIIRQTALDTFVFEVVSNKEITPEIVDEIKKKAALYLEDNLHIIIKKKDKIDRPASGKIKHFYSEIN